MARIYADSELMTNLVSAVPVPGGSYFRLLLDDDRRPLVISISNGKPEKLQLVRRGKGSSSEILDIGPCLSISASSRILAFDVQQAANLAICLCVGIVDNGKTRLVVTQPFFPSALKQGSAVPLIVGDHDIGQVERIWMLTSWGSDITRVDIAANGYEWTPGRDEEAPENTSGVIDIAPAVSFYGKGLYVLYKSDGVSKLYARFLAPDLDANDGSTISFVTSLKCPPDARCIASSFEQGDNGPASGLLIGSSEGIRYLNPFEAVKKGQVGTLITGHSALLKDLRSLEIVQDGEFSTVWFTNRREELGYIRSQKNDFSSGQSALILPANRASSFAVCVAQPSQSNGNIAWQMLMSLDHQGNLTLLQQASDTGLWRSEPFYVSSTTQNFEVESYTITIKVQNGDGMPVVSGRAFMTSASAVEATLNGVSCTLSPDGDWYDIDESGSLDFIVPTQSLAAQSLTRSKIVDTNGKSVDTTPFSYNQAAKPMQKMHEKLTSFKSVEAFVKAKTETGAPLFAETFNTKELSSAMDCLRTLGAAYAKLPQDGSSALVGSVKIVEAVTATAGNLLMDAWEWLKTKAQDAVDWVIDTAGTVWKFVCKLGGEVMQFVLDCAEKVCEAATGIWEKIKVGWQKLKDFVGFLFNWEDIKETKVTISALLTATIGAASDKVGYVEKKVDGFFDDLERKIDDFGSVGPKKISSKQEDEITSKSSDSTSASWAQERLKNGGATTSTQVEKIEKDSEAVTTWESVFQPALEKIGKDVTNVSADIAKLFRKDGGITGDDVINVSKGVLKVALNTLRGLVTSILRLVQKLCSVVIELGNKPINIPIFSALWKKISGHDLTIFDAISLLIAIPTTVMAKVMTGEKTPKIEGLDRKLVKRFIDGDDQTDEQVSYKFDVLKAEIALGLAVSKGIWNLIKIGYKTVKGGLGAGLKAVESGPASFFDMMGIVFDLYGCIASLPTERGLPGGDYRNWISAISFYSGCANLVVFMAGGPEPAEKALLVLDVVSTLTQFGLYMAVFDAEYNAKEWEDYDEDQTTVSVTECALNTVSGIGYSTAAFFKLEQPQVSGVGLIAMLAGLAGLTTLEAAKFKVQYNQKKRTRFVAPAC